MLETFLILFQVCSVDTNNRNLHPNSHPAFCSARYLGLALQNRHKQKFCSFFRNGRTRKYERWYFTWTFLWPLWNSCWSAFNLNLWVNKTVKIWPYIKTNWQCLVSHYTNDHQIQTWYNSLTSTISWPYNKRYWCRDLINISQNWLHKEINVWLLLIL